MITISRTRFPANPSSCPLIRGMHVCYSVDCTYHKYIRIAYEHKHLMASVGSPPHTRCPFYVGISIGTIRFSPNLDPSPCLHCCYCCCYHCRRCSPPYTFIHIYMKYVIIIVPYQVARDRFGKALVTSFWSRHITVWFSGSTMVHSWKIEGWIKSFCATLTQRQTRNWMVVICVYSRESHTTGWKFSYEKWKESIVVGCDTARYSAILRHALTARYGVLGGRYAF